MNETVFVFIHINKSGGTTIKRDLLQRAALRSAWDGAAFGSFKSWSLLRNFTQENLTGKKENTRSRTSNVDDYILEESRYLSCGRSVSDSSALHYLQKASCPFRIAWGALGLGLCDALNAGSCIYITLIRNPLERLISSYNYICVEGAEHKKKWPIAWKEAGYCPLNITEFFDKQVSKGNDSFAINPNLIMERLSRGCASTFCAEQALQVAKANLLNPCMKYIILENFLDGIEKIRSVFGEVFDTEIINIENSNDHRNEKSHGTRVTEQLNQPGVIESLKKIVSYDMELYNFAVEEYENSWNQPIKSC